MIQILLLIFLNVVKLLHIQTDHDDHQMDPKQIINQFSLEFDYLPSSVVHLYSYYLYIHRHNNHKNQRIASSLLH
jgi:hypothetical protein